MEKNNNHKEEQNELYKIIELYEKNEKIKAEDFIEMFEGSLTRILAKDIDPEIEIKLEINRKDKIANIYNINGEVVEDNEAQDLATSTFLIGITEAKKIDSNIQIGDKFKILINLSDLKKIFANSEVLANTKKAEEKGKRILNAIYNAFKQNISEYKKKQIFLKFSPRIGEEFEAKVLDKNNDGSFNVSLRLEDDLVSAYLPKENISSRKILKNGESLKVILESVSEDSKLSQLCVSVDSPKILEEKLKREIPEIAEGYVEIVSLVRKPGERTKIAVVKTSKAPADMDEIGSIIGNKGERINAISNDLDGEKIDVIRYSNDIKQFLKSAMSPAKVIDIVAKKDKPDCKNFFVIVEKKNLTNSIGKKGINVSLASALTKTKIDVISIEEAEEKKLKFTKIIPNSERIFVPRNNAPRKRKNSNSEYFGNIDIDMTDFNSDLESFKEKEQEMFETQDIYLMGNEDLYSKHLDQEINENKEEDENTDNLISKEQEENKTKEEPKIKTNYKEVKEAIKNFKDDKDLANFGLDNDINLDDINNADWDE